MKLKHPDHMTTPKPPDNKPRRPRAGTQLAVILGTLEAQAMRWVPLDLLMREARCGATHSAIAKLRGMGWRIENRQASVSGVRHSDYRLIPNSMEVAAS